MGALDARRGRFGVLVTIALLLLASVQPPGPAFAADLPKREPSETAAARLLDRPTRLSLFRAMERATEKLERKRCRGIFTDFRDREGRTLQQNLDDLGADGPGFLRQMVFVEGRGLRECGNPRVLALTSPGSRLIYLCGPQFREMEWRDPMFISALLIHEELHALGLPENPPHGQAITARVISRCGR